MDNSPKCEKCGADLGSDGECKCDMFPESEEYSTEVKKLWLLVREFAEEMYKELRDKIEEKGGWDNKTFTIEMIKKEIIEHIEKERPIGIANFAAFWWFKAKGERDVGN